MPSAYDVCVIGGGMAGLSVAAELAAARRVVLVEREEHLAYHSTGRSAALFAESYGNAQIRALTRASRAFYVEPRGGGSLTGDRGELLVADVADEGLLERIAAEQRESGADLRRLSAEEAVGLCPALRAERIAGALLDPGARDIDVAAVVSHYLRSLRAQGGEIRRNAEVRRIERHDGLWRIDAGDARLDAAIVVDAAGAWADRVAALAGVAPIGLTPRLRTAVRVAAGDWRIAAWPCVIDAAERWYFRPDAQALMLSPADETPVAACDAQPDDETVAETIARIEEATRLVVDRPIATWAGLRTFTPDRTPAVGFDSAAPGFFWLAGQGGYGIQAAPALARLAAALIEDRAAPPDLADHGVERRALDPQRLRVQCRC